jgi:hypothetical protein
MIINQEDAELFETFGGASPLGYQKSIKSRPGNPLILQSVLNNTKFIRDLDHAFSKLSKLRDPALDHTNDPFESTSLTRSSLEASLGLGRAKAIP